MPDINDVFDLLEKWGQLPNYQMERRADIFFGLYLGAVLDKFVGQTKPILIPELPVKKDGSNLSDKIDYVGLTDDGQTMLLVELKTDAMGHRREQIKYLIRAVNELKPRGILMGLQDVVSATRSGKYTHLIGNLQHLCIWPPDNSELPMACRLVIVQPTQYLDDATIALLNQPPVVSPLVIDFRMFAEVVEGLDDELSRRFAKTLRAWAVSAEHEIQAVLQRKRRSGAM